MFKKHFFWLFCTVLFIAAPGVLLAQKTTERNYYPIYGSFGGELSREMTAKGPRGFSAYTESSLRYEYRTTETARGCRLSSVKIDYKLIYTLPRWENQSSAPAELVARWQKFYDALSRHENNHGAIADEMYSTLQARFSQLGVKPSCAEFSALMQQELAQVRAEATAKHQAYDSVTQHGMTEGASHGVLFTSGISNGLGEASELSFIQQNWLWLLLSGFVFLGILRR